MSAIEEINLFLRNCMPLYQRPDITRDQILSVIHNYPNLRIETFQKGSDKSLKLSGPIPIHINGETNQVSIELIVNDSHPKETPELYINISDLNIKGMNYF